MKSRAAAIFAFAVCMGVFSRTAVYGAEHGLFVSYYDNRDFTAFVARQVEPGVNASWPTGVSPLPVMAPTTYAVRWQGQLVAPLAGVYRLYLTSDDGIRLWLNGRLLVDDWTDHAPTTASIDVTLTAGVLNDLRIDYYQNGGGAVARLEWSGPGRTRQVVPATALLATLHDLNGSGLTATYYDNADFTGTSTVRTDEKVDFSWLAGVSPAANIAGSTYSVRWTGLLQPQWSGEYTFSLTSDDGVRLWIGDELLIDNWTHHASTKNTASITLHGGVRYPIRLDYFNGSGPGVARLLWARDAQPAEVVPPVHLYPESLGTPVILPPPQPLTLETPVESHVSPAWVEGLAPRREEPVAILVDGLPADVYPTGRAGWYASNARAGQPLGIILSPDQSTRLDVTSNSGDIARLLTWSVTDLANLPYSLTQTTIRPGDSLLLALTCRPGETFAVDLRYDGTFTPDWTGGEESAPRPVRFDALGAHDIRARINGAEVGRLLVTVVSADLRGPIACQVGFTRPKDIALLGLTSASVLPQPQSNDIQGFLVATKQDLSASQKRLHLCPVRLGSPMLEMRLGDAVGPLVARQPIDEFVIQSSANRTITLIKTFPDGTRLLEAHLEMRPLVRGLDVRMRAFIAGVTFDDSLTEHAVSSDQFVEMPDGTGRYTYRMLIAPNITVRACHTIGVWQQGTRISF